MEILSR